MNIPMMVAVVVLSLSMDGCDMEGQITDALKDIPFIGDFL